ncbi:uncharacterized protein LOC132953051 [Metopolophium dirhodum]|uniref:uncharacterized protein LOC132953051 n=1 Tax=Metopolophium dirhodum TaxID=44670 RepID=UPI0029904473|nr:uncharacterized protein LOC132953051 [Metopolophium dirhodum]
MVLLLDEDENNDHVASKKCSIWVHDILKKRKIDEEYVTLCKMFQFNVLFLKIENSITKQNTHFRGAIPPKEKLDVCLRFLGTGVSYQTIAFSFRLGHSTVQLIVLEICSAIISKLKDEYLSIPGEEDWKRITKEFWEIWNFPNCIGALDVLLALVDAQYTFLAVDIGAFGKNSDGGILSNSNFEKL